MEPGETRLAVTLPGAVRGEQKAENEALGAEISQPQEVRVYNKVQKQQVSPIPKQRSPSQETIALCIPMALVQTPHQQVQQQQVQAVVPQDIAPATLVLHRRFFTVAVFSVSR